MVIFLTTLSINMSHIIINVHVLDKQTKKADTQELVLKYSSYVRILYLPPEERDKEDIKFIPRGKIRTQKVSSKFETEPYRMYLLHFVGSISFSGNVSKIIMDEERTLDYF
jgi:hypothetical protein